MKKPAHYSEIIKKNITFFRKQAHLTQVELATLCGVSTSTIAHVESSGAGLSLSLIEKISTQLKKPIYLFFMDEHTQARLENTEQQQQYIKNMLQNIIDTLK